MQLPKFLSSSSRSPLSSATPSKNVQTTPVGASVSLSEHDPYIFHSRLLKWIQETKKKLPVATPRIRREAFEADPLLSGTIFPYLRNILLKGFSIQTKDNKLYEAAITEITDWIELIELLKVFRDDYRDYGILVGHSYRRVDPDWEGNISWLEKIDPSVMFKHTDPHYSSIIFYHQHALVNLSFDEDSPVTQVEDNWYIPYGTKIKDVNATYSEGRTEGNDSAVKDLFETYKTKYHISKISNLGIASSERIISMHNTEWTPSINRYYDDGDYNKAFSPAPIDSIILAIWLKRQVLSSAPNLINVILSPSLHHKIGVMKESKDALNNPVIISSLPQPPNPNEQTSNPAKYANDLAKYTAFEKALKDSGKNIKDCFEEGGVVSTPPDHDLKPIESNRAVPSQFIKIIVDLLDEEICQGLGLPIALIRASGAELASSRNIAEMFNTAHASDRNEYESVADKLIKKQFAGRTWKGKTTKKDEKTGKQKEIEVTYTFEEIKAHFVLDVPDTKDLKAEAETLKLKSETLVNIKAIGASKEDEQALGTEYGFGMLGLDNYEAPMNSPEGGSVEGGATQQITAILKACLMSVMEEQGLISAKPTDPSGFEDKALTEKLKDVYKVAQNTIDELFEED